MSQLEHRWTPERAGKLEGLLQTRVELAELSAHSTTVQLMEAAVDAAESLTHSSIGFFHFVDEDQEHLTLSAWSTHTRLHMCSAQPQGHHYPISLAGVWVDCVHARRPVIHNDYASLPHRKGYPEGHAPVRRELVVPVMRGDKVLAIMGVGNKADPYVEEDVESVVRLSSLVIDLVTRLQAEEESRRYLKSLKQSEAEFRGVFQASPVGIELYDRDGSLVEINRAGAELLGVVGPEVLQGLRLLDDPRLPAETREAVERGQEARCEIKLDFASVHFPTRRSGVIDMAMVLIPLGPDQPLSYVVHLRDITKSKRAEEERRRLDARLQHAQKLESLGSLAGGIAHDFNNILQAILGNAELAKHQLPAHSLERECLEEIEASAQRAATLAHQMLAYSGRGHFVLRSLNLSQIVREMSRLLDSSISKKVTMTVELDSHLPAVRSDAAQIRQVLMNLVVNASEALEHKEGGEIRVVTAARRFTAQELDSSVLPHKLAPGDYVTLEVRDDGCGMDAPTLDRLFDPFFTTKRTGRGLGMSAVLGIVRGHQGAILVESSLGRGTRIQVLFPIAAESPLPSAPPTTPGKGTILLVDDEPAVRSVGQRLLQRLGYRVITAADGLEAVELFKKSEVDCVLLDLSMPRWDGEQAFRELRCARPDCPIVVASGYSEQETLERFGGQSVSGFVQKPYSLKTLSEKLGQVLSGSAKARSASTLAPGDGPEMQTEGEVRGKDG